MEETIQLINELKDKYENLSARAAIKNDIKAEKIYSIIWLDLDALLSKIDTVNKN